MSYPRNQIGAGAPSTTLCKVGTREAIIAALVYLVAHAGYKGALFLLAGAIDHETGTRDMRRLGGLWRFMPITATLAMVESTWPM